MKPSILLWTIFFLGAIACNSGQSGKGDSVGLKITTDAQEEDETQDGSNIANALLVSPKHPSPGESIRILVVGDRSIRKTKILVNGPEGSVISRKIKEGEGIPFWRIEEFKAGAEGAYTVKLDGSKEEVMGCELWVKGVKDAKDVKGGGRNSGMIWKTERGWNGEMEALYSAWMNALFDDADERSSWAALHEVTRNPERNFFYNHLGLNEDDPAGKVTVIMEPDCADNPYYLRAYFAWKLGLPFGYHETDRGWVGKPPQTGRWITNETPSSQSNPVLAFNAFLRRVMDGVHSGSARAALNNDNSDYYPVPLTPEALRPGVVFADPYGHTLILVKKIPQSGNKPGLLLSVDAQPDGTVAVKRFWKGNFLFTTDGVVGEPGFKTFRPIVLENNQLRLPKNNEFPEIYPPSPP